MQLTIDNLDGKGAISYTNALSVGVPLVMERVLNAPSRCTAELLQGVCGLALPMRNGRVVVTSDAGTVMFTGYLATEPVAVYRGMSATTGTQYAAKITAISDEWLLDKQGPAVAGTSLALDAGTLLQRLTSRVQTGASTLAVETEGVTLQTLSVFRPDATASWSESAGSAAAAAYAGYRALAGQVTLQPAASVTHAVADTDGTLVVQDFNGSNVRELANDVTLSGGEEPAAYVTEIFEGDGTTSVFTLSEAPMKSTHATLLEDSFDEAAIDAQVWAWNDPGSRLSLTSAGLTMNGGNGFDGQTTLASLDMIEMGGAVTVQLSGVVLSGMNASDGMLGAMYNGLPVLANCFAGFRVRQQTSGTSSTTVIVPVVNGAEVGAVFTPLSEHTYTLRLRLWCAEMLRLGQVYSALVEGVVQSFGSAGGVDAAMQVVFELVDEGAASNTPATVLFDTAVNGAATGTPARCTFVAVNSTQVYGSVSAIRVTRPGSMWVQSQPPSAQMQTRLMGLAGEGVDCTVEYGSTATTGKVTFLAGRVPVANEVIRVLYRGQQRSVARMANAASIMQEAATGVGLARWLGKVISPEARCSVDCESAAQALLAMSTSRAAALRGSYAQTNPASDVWPGDVLSATIDGVTTSMLVRAVTIEDTGAIAETLNYKLALANDWAAELADGLGVRVSEAISADAVLPMSAETTPGAMPANLPQMTVAVSGAAIAIDAGVVPPAGGGFEVRRRDFDFSAASDVDLVMRSPVRSFSIPRAAQVERYFVRMYDASTPPVYSRFSSAVLVNAPLSM
jgi:hypothetical protein